VAKEKIIMLMTNRFAPALRKYAELGHVYRNSPCVEFPGSYHFYSNGYEVGILPGEVGEAAALAHLTALLDKPETKSGKLSVSWCCSDNDPRVGQVWFSGYYCLQERKVW
jgi:hypothetical protein